MVHDKRDAKPPAGSFEVPLVCYHAWDVTREFVDTAVRRATAAYAPLGVHVYAAAVKEIPREAFAKVLGLDSVDKSEVHPQRGPSRNRYTQPYKWCEQPDNAELPQCEVPQRAVPQGEFDKILQAFIPTSVIGALFVNDTGVAVEGGDRRGFSTPAYQYGSGCPKLAMADLSSGPLTLAHELGHLLMDMGHGAD